MDGDRQGTGGVNEPWAELLSYIAVAFALGVLFGLGAFLASDKAKESVDWGSYADWFAAGAGILAAASGIAIALIARGELARRHSESRSVAVASANWAICADLEMTVRLTRQYHRAESNRWKALLDLATSSLSFETPEAIPDVALVAALPSKMVEKIVACKGHMKLCSYTGKRVKERVEKKKNEIEEDLLFVANMERLAEELLPIAAFLRQELKRKAPVPWSDWKPVLNAAEIQNAQMKKYHQTQ